MSEHLNQNLETLSEGQTNSHKLKAYQTPRLRDLGTFSDLTQAGGANFNPSDDAATGYSDIPATLS